jgi:hypothetical protein
VKIDRNNLDKLSYLVGVFLGDGCCYFGKNSYQFSITSSDYDLCLISQNICNKIFNKSGRIKTIYKDNRVSYYQLVICSKYIVRFFSKLTYKRKKIPSFIYGYKKDFIQGLMDSDGWICKVNATDGYIRYRIGFKNTSLWIKEFKEILNGLEVRTGNLLKNKINCRAKLESYSFSINTSDYISKIGFKIERKKELSKKYGIIS